MIRLQRLLCAELAALCLVEYNAFRAMVPLIGPVKPATVFSRTSVLSSIANLARTRKVLSDSKEYENECVAGVDIKPSGSRSN